MIPRSREAVIVEVVASVLAERKATERAAESGVFDHAAIADAARRDRPSTLHR